MNWKKTIGAIAPVIGTALGGPFGGLAGTVLGKVLGVDDPTDDAALGDAVKQAMADPDLVIKLKTAEIEFKAKLKELGVRESEIYAEDRASARDMQKANKSVVPGTLTFLLVAIAGVLVYFVMTSDMTNVDKTLVGTVIGYVFSELKQATSFWFGSSKGSQDKNVFIGNK